MASIDPRDLDPEEVREARRWLLDCVHEEEAGDDDEIISQGGLIGPTARAALAVFDMAARMLEEGKIGCTCHLAFSDTRDHRPLYAYPEPGETE